MYSSGLYLVGGGLKPLNFPYRRSVLLHDTSLLEPESSQRHKLDRRGATLPKKDSLIERLEGFSAE